MVIGVPDLAIVVIILLSIFIGIIRGLIKESISLVTWLVAIMLAVLYSSGLSEHMTFTQISLVRSLTAFLLIFVGTVFVGAIFNYLVGSFIRKTPFSIPDRILGSAFGLLRGVVFVTILTLLAGLTPLPDESWWQESYALSRFQVLAIWLKDRLPDEHAQAFRFPSDDIKGQKKLTQGRDLKAEILRHIEG